MFSRFLFRLMQKRHFVFLTAILFVLSACSAARNVSTKARPKEPLYDQSPVYNKVNLHPYSNRNVLTTVNYQLPGFIPRCTKIKFNMIEPDKAVFTIVDTGEQYEYALNGHTQESLRSHLKKVFSPECSDEDLSNLNETDMKGIRAGDVRIGMTKQGVIYALGYPPDHRTPSTEANEWLYWKHHFDRFRVHFNDEGKVVRIEN